MPEPALDSPHETGEARLERDFVARAGPRTRTRPLRQVRELARRRLRAQVRAGLFAWPWLDPKPCRARRNRPSMQRGEGSLPSAFHPPRRQRRLRRDANVPARAPRAAENLGQSVPPLCPFSFVAPFGRGAAITLNGRRRREKAERIGAVTARAGCARQECRRAETHPCRRGAGGIKSPAMWDLLGEDAARWEKGRRSHYIWMGVIYGWE